MADTFELEAHREWISYVQPTGLVVAPSVLNHRGIVPDRNISVIQKNLLEVTVNDQDERPVINDISLVLKNLLNWSDNDLIDSSRLPAKLTVPLEEYSETLAPSFAVPETNSEKNQKYQMLISVESTGTDLDSDIKDDGKHWVASPHARFERLLRESEVPVGLLFNGQIFRLIYAPKGESSGFMNFTLSAMTEVSGRPILAAFHMLLNTHRLFGRAEQSLPFLLKESREHQDIVSTELAKQVMSAMHELLRGLTIADTQRKETRILELAAKEPDHLYAGILTALLRLVFVLYAEDRGLFPRKSIWVQHYSLAGLYERLNHDASFYPDTMDDRFGAWAHLISLWRLVHSGGKHNDLNLVARRGQLFNPDRFLFLEGRNQASDTCKTPLVSDGVVRCILRCLMVLNGDRLSYRTLDVEQIGSVYQAIMGFTIEITNGDSIAINAPKNSGAAAIINLNDFVNVDTARKKQWLKNKTGRSLTEVQLENVESAVTIKQLLKALDPVIDRHITPNVLPSGIPVLQPTELRRKTGSHYTPRSLTSPIVAEAIRPVYERIGGTKASPEKILELKVLDPAVGSGAFLVEACRQIAEKLVISWQYHSATPKIPPDENMLLYARRLVAQKCIYGVDRNAMATNLAKLSLWLVTLASDKEFTFLDHAILHGDSLVGLFQDQIIRVDWKPGNNASFVGPEIQEQLEEAQRIRHKIQLHAEKGHEAELQQLLDKAKHKVKDLEILGNTTVHAFFSASNSKQREIKREELLAELNADIKNWQASVRKIVGNMKNNNQQVFPFHWELQFPEVFLREKPGFDMVVGNPPFAGKNTIINGSVNYYLDWLKSMHDGSHGNADLAAHFFRRSFLLLRKGGTLGLIATNTISQGDTRNTGLRWLRENGGIIYSAERSYKWPGQAAVIVSKIHIAKECYEGEFFLDNNLVPQITAYLSTDGVDNDPVKLLANANMSFQGSILLGMGFTFDNTDTGGVTSTLEEREKLIEQNNKNSKRIFPYIGGEEVNQHPSHDHHRYTINFENFPLKRDKNLPKWETMGIKERKAALEKGIVPIDYIEPVAEDWPDLLKIVEDKVKPERDKLKMKSRRDKWWLFGAKSSGLYKSISSLDRVLVCCRVSNNLAFTFLSSKMIYADTIVVFSINDYALFAILQSRVHEVWALFYGSSLGKGLRYTPSDVFETFPFPGNNKKSYSELERVGREYFEHRAKTMKDAQKGMTPIYNCFHDKNDKSPPIMELRRLHDEMDKAVLHTYGWKNLAKQAKSMYESDGENDNAGGKTRYRWPKAVRSTVLSRLMELNRQRSNEEKRSGLSTKSSSKSTDSSSDESFELKSTNFDAT